MTDVRLLGEPFCAMDELTAFNAAHPEAGGLVSFLGQVRQKVGPYAALGEVEALELRHYAAMTLPGMMALAAATEARWMLDGLLILHRYGVMHPGDPIVLVAAAARHRRDAFAAADFAMDHLKGQSWFWKRERTAKGWRWIEPRPDDHRDLARW